MGGKAILLLVVGFSLIFLVLGQNFAGLTTRAVDNLVEYNAQTTAHNIAVSGANMASNQIFFNPEWTSGYNNVNYQGGTLNVTVQVLDAYKNIRKITSIGKFQSITNAVEVTLAPSKFSKFAYYSESEGSDIWWTNSDTVWGPFHTQDYLRAYQHPVFYGKVTIKKSIIYYSKPNSSHEPRFLGGFEKGIDLPLPTDGLSPIEAAANDKGYKFTGHDTVFVTFARDSIKYKFHYTSPYTTRLGTDMAPNGVIFAENAILRIKGTVKGQYSVVASGTTGGKGTIFLDDDIVYDKNPKIFSSSTDLLGIIAKKDVLITRNAANNSDINIDGSIYCEDGGFAAQDFKTRPPSGNINLLGGIIQNIRGAVGQFGTWGISSGFAKRYKYDERLLLSSPPMFPGTGGFEIVSWLE